MAKAKKVERKPLGIAVPMHVRTPEQSFEKRLHLSHLMQYVSAYEPSPEQVQMLAESLYDAWQDAKVARNTQQAYETRIVDQDGEMFFLMNANGTFDLCVRWKHFEYVTAEMT
jgi:hypothetical protein